MKLTKRNLELAWKYRGMLWRYRAVIRRRRQIAGVAAAAGAVAVGLLLRRRWSRPIAAPAAGD
jgi:hypothetical protein